MQRFRQRWGLVLGRRPTSDMLSVDIMRSKVDLLFILDTSFTESLFVLGSGKWTRFRVCKHKSNKRGCQKHGTFLYVSLEKAMASWQWFRFLLAQVPLDRKPLILNLDETSIRFWYEPRLGLRARARDRVPGRAPARQASRGLLRKAFTHIAVICDDSALQPLLPQVILVNERTCTIRNLQDWKPLPGCKAEVFRHKSAWINNAKFADVLRRIGEALKTHAPDRQAIMLMDAHTSHFSKEALVEASAQGIWPCIIPACTTSILQPLDTHVFARFKFFCEPVCIRRC